MRQVGTNKPIGGTYNRAMGAWLRENGFDPQVTDDML
jgi:hypothetical protein